MRRAKRMNEERSQYTDLQAVPDNSQKLIIAWGIGSVLGSFLIAEWVVLAFYPTNRILMAVPLILAFAVIVVSSLAQGETPRSVGIRLDNVWECLRLVLIPMLLVSIILTSVGYRFGTLRGEHGNLIIWIAKLLALALVQQFVLQAYFNRR